MHTAGGEGAGEGELNMVERRYIIKPCDRLSFGYYDEGNRHFVVSVDFLGLGTEGAVMVADIDGSRLLAMNPDLITELPFICWCSDSIIPLLEEHGFTPLEGATV